MTPQTASSSQRFIAVMLIVMILAVLGGIFVPITWLKIVFVVVALAALGYGGYLASQLMRANRDK
jgi:threonine/homoserine/homoserine lactone efflux protein